MKIIHYATVSFMAKKKRTDEYRQMLVKKAYTKPTTGNESLHNKTNNNGIKMHQRGVVLARQCPSSPGTCNPEETVVPRLPVS